ncbi:MAG TPA: hypothetical protein VFR91_10150 [Dyella sp.]|nr:hypothetical protein [Dyella sp.]
MDTRRRSFIEQFDAMPTNLLLHRYKQGGLVPEAAAALLDVLESRGYSREKADEQLRLAETAAIEKAVAKLEATEKARARAARLSVDPVLKRLRVLLWGIVAPVAMLFILLAILLLGNFIVIEGASRLGCNLGENAVHLCFVLGHDMGSFVYGYLVDIFVLGAFNPFFSAELFLKFLQSTAGILWMLGIAAIILARRIRRHSLC